MKKVKYIPFHNRIPKAFEDVGIMSGKDGHVLALLARSCLPKCKFAPFLVKHLDYPKSIRIGKSMIKLAKKELVDKTDIDTQNAEKILRWAGWKDTQ